MEKGQIGPTVAHNGISKVIFTDDSKPAKGEQRNFFSIVINVVVSRSKGRVDKKTAGIQERESNWRQQKCIVGSKKSCP